MVVEEVAIIIKNKVNSVDKIFDCLMASLCLQIFGYHLYGICKIPITVRNFMFFFKLRNK